MPINSMGNLFEQALLITFDMINMNLRVHMGITPQEKNNLYRNLERLIY